MTISFDVKRCSETVVQYDGWCGKSCYGYQGNCTDPEGTYNFRIVNASAPNNIIVDYFGEALDNWNTQVVDMSNLGLNENDTYNLIFAVNPENYYDARAHCVYFDDVKIEFLQGAIPCEENYCDGEDLYIPQLINNTCVYQIRYDSIECLSDENRELASNFLDYCIDETLKTYDNDTKEWISVPNATYCVQQQEEADITEPNEVLRTYLEPYFSWLGPEWEIIVFFVSPLFIAFAIALSISFLVIQRAKIQTGHGTIFTVCFMSFLGVFSVLGLFPGWLAIVFIVLSGAIIAYQIFGRT
jgi:hypothetical protein